MLSFSNVNFVTSHQRTEPSSSLPDPGIVCRPVCHFLRNSVEREVLGIISAGQREREVMTGGGPGPAQL